MKLRRTIRELLRLENIPTYVAIVAAAVALLVPGLDPGPVILGVLGILAIDAVIERVAHFRRLHDDIEALGAELRHSIDALGRGPWLRPRSDPAFEDFGQYCEEAHAYQLVQPAYHVAGAGPSQAGRGCARRLRVAV